MATWMQFSLCDMYVASSNELEQLHMQVLLNYNLATILWSIQILKSGQ